MKAIVLKWGSFAAISGLIVFVLAKLFTDPTAQTVLDWTEGLLLVLLISLGIRQYRDKFANGLLPLARAFGLATLIIIIPTFTTVIANVVYDNYISSENQSFAAEYDRIIDINRDVLQQNEQKGSELSNQGQDSALHEIGRAIATRLDDPVTRFVASLLSAFLFGLLCALVAAAISYRTAKA